jgi:putative Ca2+/H+ antiporter (TMEM165/GDT1 family)
MGAWTLLPDRLGEEQAKSARFGAIGATLAAFFLVEMGGKTQVATVALAARYASIGSVVAGSALGMMFANVPAVLLGARLLRLTPVKALRRIAAAIFAVIGALALTDPEF